MNIRRPLLIGAIGTAALGLVPAGLAAASAHSQPTTLKFINTPTAQQSSKTGVQETGTETSHGKLLGYYALSCRFTSATALNCGGAGSFTKGMIYFHFIYKTKTNTFFGPVTGGTAAYHDATGTIIGKAGSKTAAVTITLLTKTEPQPAHQ